MEHHLLHSCFTRSPDSLQTGPCFGAPCIAGSKFLVSQRLSSSLGEELEASCPPPTPLTRAFRNLRPRDREGHGRAMTRWFRVWQEGGRWKRGRKIDYVTPCDSILARGTPFWTFLELAGFPGFLRFPILSRSRHSDV